MATRLAAVVQDIPPCRLLTVDAGALRFPASPFFHEDVLAVSVPTADGRDVDVEALPTIREVEIVSDVQAGDRLIVVPDGKCEHIYTRGQGGRQVRVIGKALAAGQRGGRVLAFLVDEGNQST